MSTDLGLGWQSASDTLPLRLYGRGFPSWDGPTDTFYVCNDPAMLGVPKEIVGPKPEGVPRQLKAFDLAHSPARNGGEFPWVYYRDPGGTPVAAPGDSGSPLVGYDPASGPFVAAVLGGASNVDGGLGYINVSEFLSEPVDESVRFITSGGQSRGLRNLVEQVRLWAPQ